MIEEDKVFPKETSKTGNGDKNGTFDPRRSN